MPQAPYTLEQAEEDVGNLRGQLAYLGEIGSGLNFGITGTAGASFPGITITAASLQNFATATVPAGNPAAGAVYQLDVLGDGTWGSTAQTLTLQCAYGGNTPNGGSVAIGASAFPVNQAFRWRACVRAYCVTTGATGTWQMGIHGAFSVFGANLVPGTTANQTGGYASVTNTVVTVDTTVAQTLALQASWNSTTGTPSATSRVAIFKRIA